MGGDLNHQPNNGDDRAAERKRSAALRRKYPEHFVKRAGKWVMVFNPDWNLRNADWIKHTCRMHRPNDRSCGCGEKG